MFLHNRRSAPSTISINGVRLRFAVIDGDSGDQVRCGFEVEVYDYIDRLPQDCVFYDLGASIGHFSLYAAARGLRTCAFEPDLKNFNALSLNKTENGLSNLRIFNVAIADGADSSGILLSNSMKQRVGDHHKVLKLSDNSASPSILDQLDSQQIVETWSMDEAIEIKGLPVPNYMKIDIDGSEVAFLKGATKTLANPALNGFIMELSKDSQYYEHILNVLGGFGLTPNQEYKVYSSVGLEPNLFNITFTRS
jgi:FkbM family methyltransferase